MSSSDTGQNESTDVADSDDDDSGDSVACLHEMLGGISFTGDWTEEDTQESGMPNSVKLTPGRVDPSATEKRLKRPLRHITAATPTSDGRRMLEAKQYSREASQDLEDDIFRNAYRCSGHCTADHMVEKPPVQVVDFGDSNRGRGLVATRFISKGDVIYTERPLTATQLLPAKHKERISACQTCFRSLEAWTKLISWKQNEEDDGVLAANLFPFPELWPVMALDFEDDDVVKNDASTTIYCTSIRTDRYGRIQCTHCQALFCCHTCYSKKIDQFGSCCFETKVQKALPGLLKECDTDEGDLAIETPVALASSMFLQMIHYYRGRNASIEEHFVNRVCGTADDLCLLELGKRVANGENSTTYTLQPLYDYLLELAELNEHEKQMFSLQLFHGLASKAARNGVGLTTQSPFKPYHAGLLRKTNYGGRSSEAHNRHMRRLAAALGTDHFHRGMDREIEALVAPEISGLFPLTTHCNHSCHPNAQIRSQQFAEALIDVVATEDIAAGEELCISYIELGGVRWGRRSKFQRRKELQRRYLFYCECTKCTDGDD